MYFKRQKVICRHCGKPFFLMGLPIVSITRLPGLRIKIERMNLKTKKSYSQIFDGVSCSTRCNRVLKKEGLNVFNYKKSLEMTDTRRCTI